MLKNHNCFVLYLNCNLLFSRNIFFKKCYIFLKNSWKLKSKIFLWIFFSCITSCSHKMYKIKTRIILCFFLECTTYNLIFPIFFSFILLREFFYFAGIISNFLFLCVFFNHNYLVTFLSIALLKFMVPSIEINVKNHNWSCWESGHEKPMKTKKKKNFIFSNWIPLSETELSSKNKSNL